MSTWYDRITERFAALAQSQQHPEGLNSPIAHNYNLAHLYHATSAVSSLPSPSHIHPPVTLSLVGLAPHHSFSPTHVSILFSSGCVLCRSQIFHPLSKKMFLFCSYLHDVGTTTASLPQHAQPLTQPSSTSHHWSWTKSWQPAVHEDLA